ncbi:MAG TPA: uroporphyrinogen-III C-methyltransferase [Armatimonadota bacterium]|nr:uroporphyrinogen-III C-methyltransferase [Armatimonadota bacterium]
MSCGKVYLIGAGPGDPGLLTIKGLKCISKADVILYDRLVHPAILAHTRSDAELIYVGKASSGRTVSQDQINRLLVDKAREGKIVVRLKGGDPFVFGRGGEEAEALAEQGIPFEVIPGVTSATAVPAYAGIPVTHRDFCSTLGIITGHEADSDQPSPPPPPKERGSELQSAVCGLQSKIRWDKIATGVDTLVFLMGVENLPNIVAELVKNGRDPSTPIALIRWGTRAEQETLVGTLADIVQKARRAGFKPPAVAVVGEVVNLREKLRWFDLPQANPLFGKRVLVTRSREQAETLSELLREHGAEPIEFPVIKISPPESFAELDAALDRIEGWDWLLFTSANGVQAMMERLTELGRDVRWLKGPKIGAIGPKTAEAIRSLGINVDFIPSRFVSEAIADEFPESPSGKRILILRAEEAREILPEKLRERGAQVDVVAAYRTEMEQSDAAQIRQLLRSGGIDIVTFTSSSTVKGFVALIGEGDLAGLAGKVTIACIGPITAQAAEEHGLKPDVVAEEHTIEGLIEALAADSAGDSS